MVIPLRLVPNVASPFPLALLLHGCLLWPLDTYSTTRRHRSCLLATSLPLFVPQALLHQPWRFLVCWLASLLDSLQLYLLTILLSYLLATLLHLCLGILPGSLLICLLTSVQYHLLAIYLPIALIHLSSSLQSNLFYKLLVISLKLLGLRLDCGFHADVTFNTDHPISNRIPFPGGHPNSNCHVSRVGRTTRCIRILYPALTTCNQTFRDSLIRSVFGVLRRGPLGLPSRRSHIALWVDIYG